MLDAVIYYALLAASLFLLVRTTWRMALGRPIFGPKDRKPRR